jgi:dihydroxyacetone kinase-like protein
MAVDRDGTLAWLRKFADEMSEHRVELVRLDTAIGDGDHGTNMDRGMRAALAKLDATEAENPGAVLKTAAMVLVSKVGGAAGPLYGTLFLQLGTAMGDRSEIDSAGWAQAWRRGLEGVQARGKAEPGDKTMVDALMPAVEALERGMQATVPLVARKGRASYLGERSKDHQDPGATSTYYLFKSAAETLAD